MPSTIDSLQIEINAQAVKANTAIDNLVVKLNTLSSSLGRINGSNLTGLANGVQRLGTAMQTMSTVRTSDFTRLANNITKLGNINTASLNSAASSMSQLTRAFNSLGTISANAMAVGELAKNIAKLGNKSVQTAVTNIPQLATALKNLMQTLSTAPRVSNNIIQMTNALSNLASQGSRLGTATNSINSGLIRTNSTMISSKKHAFSLASAFGKFYANLFLVIRAIKALWKSIEGTTDYIEAFNYYNVSFEKIASEWSKYFEKYGYENAESYAESFTDRINESFEKMSGIKVEISEDGTGLLTDTGLKNLGLNIQEITQYASQLASVTNSVGQTGEVSLVAAQSFTKLGADISSLFNVDYSSAMSNLQSGLIGQSRALYKYGIDITNATLQTYAYELGLSKAVSEMTQAEKMQLRMIAILDQSKVSWGDLANTINTPSNMIRQLKNNLEEVGTVLGQLFIPLLQKVLPVINGITIALKTLLVNIAGFFGVKLDLDDFSQGYTDLGDSLDDVVDSYDEATDSAKKFKGQLAGFDKLNTISTQSSASDNGSSGLGSSIDLTDEILAASSAYEKVWNEAYANMENEAQKFADKIVEVFKTGNFESVGTYISNKLTNALSSINWNSVYSGAENFGSGLAGFLNGLITPELFDEVGKTIANTLNTAIYSALSFGEEFDFYNFGESIATGLKSFFNNFDFEALADTLNTWVDGIEDTIAGFLSSITWDDILETVSKTGEFLGDLELDTVAVILGGFLLKYKGKELTAAILNSGITSKLSGLASTMAPIAITVGASIAIIFTSFELGKSIADSFYEWYNEKYGTDIDTSFLENMSFGEMIQKAFEMSLKDPNLEHKVFGTSLGPVFEDSGIDIPVTAYLAIHEALVDGWVEKIEEWWGDVQVTVTATFLTLKTTVLGWWNNVKRWWGLRTVTVTATFLTLKTTVLGWWNNVKSWWGARIVSVSATFTTVKTTVTGWWNNVKSWWGNPKVPVTAIFATASTTVTGWWNSVKSWWGEKKLSISAKTPNFLQTVKDAWNQVTYWWNNNKPSLPDLSLKMKVPHISITYDRNAWNASIFKALGFSGTPKFSVSYYAQGGFPEEDGWFRASHGEIMGKFDNGQSVVANNMQITEGISDAVYRGNQALLKVMQQELTETRKQNETLKQLLAKETGISKSDIFNSVRSSAKEYKNRTGNLAFT